MVTPHVRMHRTNVFTYWATIFDGSKKSIIWSCFSGRLHFVALPSIRTLLMWTHLIPSSYTCECAPRSVQPLPPPTVIYPQRMRL